MALAEIKISRYPGFVRGLVLKETEQWIVLKRNVVDYVLDGDMFINKAYVKRINLLPPDSLDAQIMSLKQEGKAILPDWIDTDRLLCSLCEAGTLVDIGLESQDYVLVGYIVSVAEKSFRLRMIGTKGEMLNAIRIESDKIRTLVTDSDYLQSLEMYREWIKNSNK